MAKHILAYGNPVYDLISTPALRRDERVLSGCSTNACLAAAKLGERATLVGTVGADYEAVLRKDLEERGVQGALFAAQQTGGFSLIYDERGDRELSILGIANPVPAYVDGYRNIDFVLIGPILGETSVELVRTVREQIGAPILLDPQGLLRGVRNGEVSHDLTESYTAIAAMSTVVKANELETRVVTGIEPRADPEAAARALHECGCEIAIVTLAEAGSVIYDGENLFHIPAYETNAIDPTGAGDTYAAGFMVAHLEKPKDLSYAGCFAAAVSSVMVENSGPDFPLTRQEADRRSNKLLNGPLALKL